MVVFRALVILKERVSVKVYTIYLCSSDIYFND